ncbi:hypothetical protein CVT26_001460 [Gymnopilus dilepis]|uniref:Uncharacterized protein n=1 Tax=Gymnopilus dilepis TaxID=231916 RepID=A0A409WBF9_9AGAR|nr:hypothetical protein CVT26_001460 [Gymnopilus dilepis]
MCAPVTVPAKAANPTAHSTCFALGLAKMSPATEAESVHRPVYPACAGSWPEPPPEMTAVRRGVGVHVGEVVMGSEEGDEGEVVGLAEEVEEAVIVWEAEGAE